MERFRNLISELTAAELPTVSKPVALDRESARLAEWLASANATFVPEYRVLKRLYADACGRLRIQDGFAGIPERLIARLPSLLYENFGGQVDLASDADFRARFGESFATLPGELKEEALRNLWLQLLRKCGPERPSIGYWSDFLFSHVPDGATEDLRYARLAIARYAVFRGGGGTVSAAVFGSVRNKVFGSASGAASSGASWSDKGFIARLRTVCTALAGSSAGAEPTELLDRLDSIFAENSRIMRLVEDDPERGFEILNALVMPLGAGLESPGGPPPPAWVPAFRARAVPQIAQLFSYPSGNPSCFWKGSPEAASRFGRILAEDAIGFYFARIPETAGMDAAERAACWRGLARNGAFLDAWAALEDGGVTPPDPGPGGYPGHGILKEGPPGRSALFLRLPRLLLADWSDGTTFVWTEGSHPSPAMRLPAYHYCDVVDHKSYSEIQRGPWWKAEITHALVLAGEVGLPGAGG